MRPTRPITDVNAELQLQVSTALVRGLSEVIQQRLKAAAGCNTAPLDSLCKEPVDRMFPLSELRALIAQLVRDSGEPALGLYWGMHASPASFGLMTPLVTFAPTLRHALALVARFHTLVTDGARFQIEECLGVARLRCELPPGLNRSEPAMVEMMLAGLVRMFQEFHCTQEDIRAVCVEYPRPAHYRTYGLAFGNSARFSQSFTGIELDASALDRRHLHHRAELQALMLVEAERSLERRARPRGHAERVLALLGSTDPQHVPDMRDMARRLGLGERSLRRRLEEEGTSYRELVQSHLYKHARALLRDESLTLQEVGAALGFADPAAFHRAFRRWSNSTPAEYRQSR